MIIAYDSKTGNVQRFVSKLDMPSIQIENNMIMVEPFVMVTYTTGFGKVPPLTKQFLANNRGYLRGVASSGNRNWGQGFGKAGDVIASEMFVPLILKFELSGEADDIVKFQEGVRQLEACRIKQLSNAVG
ncbi:ribonucleotide reductase stimulatory protein [compost metagenome]